MIHPDFEDEGILPPGEPPKIEKEVSGKLGQTSETILQLMRESPQITIAEVDEKTGVSTRAVQKHIAKLHIAKRIERIGARQYGT